MATNSVQRFPTKEELIKRFMHEFQLYHQFEFEEQESQNNDMKREDFMSLFRQGRAFKAKVLRYGVYSSQFDQSDISSEEQDLSTAVEGESRIKSGSLAPPKDWESMSKSSEMNFNFTLSLDTPENKFLQEFYRLEEIAPSAKPRSGLSLLRSRPQSCPDSKGENKAELNGFLISSRKGLNLEVHIKCTVSSFEKLIEALPKTDFFFGCSNDLTIKQRVKELILELEMQFQSHRMFSSVADFLAGNPAPVQMKKEIPAIVEGSITDLNESQKESIRSYFSSDSFYLTVGPPGTGKSQVICKFLELCHQLDYRVLVCSMSHAAVDNVLLRFAGSAYYQRWKQANPAKSFVARCGVEQFIDPAARRYGKEFYFPAGDKKAQDKKVEMFKNSSIFFSTMTGSFSRSIRTLISESKLPFDYILVDEAAMCVDPFIFMAMSLGNKMIMAGDHHQLRPILKTKEAMSTNLTTSLFQKLIEVEAKLQPEVPISNCLSVQYRMSSSLVTASSKYFYDSKVMTHTPIQKIDLRGLGAATGQILPTNYPLVWVDHNGFETDGSKNVTEAEIVAKLLKDLVCNMKIKAKDIGIISAYKAQISLINQAIKREGLEFFDDELLIGSIDAFQGGEREVVIIATTRNNHFGGIGFLKQEERLNVAVTRAKRLCVFIGASGTLVSKKNKFISDYYTHVESVGQILRYDEYNKSFSHRSEHIPLFITKKQPKRKICFAERTKLF